MAQPKTFPMFLDTGQRRQGKIGSHRLFFVYVTPTGAEIGLNQCPNLRTKLRRPMGFDPQFTGQNVITEYLVYRPLRIKMVNNRTRLGKPAVYVNLYIDVAPGEALIEVKGLDGFGGFRGNGRVDLPNSTIVDRTGKVYPLTDKKLRDHFTYSVLQSPTGSAKSKNVRSLIY